MESCETGSEELPPRYKTPTVSNQLEIHTASLSRIVAIMFCLLPERPASCNTSRVVVSAVDNQPCPAAFDFEFFSLLFFCILLKVSRIDGPAQQCSSKSAVDPHKRLAGDPAVRTALNEAHKISVNLSFCAMQPHYGLECR